MRAAQIALGLVLLLSAPTYGQSVARPAETAADLDRDGIADSTEQALLEKFLPVFLVGMGECDQAPSLFLAGASDPVPVEQDGTIYGQAFPGPSKSVGGSDALVELHFYHLWRQDCGKRSHALDAEHVSALVTAPSLTSPAEQWRALYWYASSHQGTPCDKSHAASASTVHAVETGPQVVISAGKHASYLDAAQCKRGCGADRCENSVVLVVPRVVNLGEPGAPLNGSEWTGSSQWALREKMTTDFSSTLLAEMQLPSSTGFIAVHKPIAGMQTTILTAGVTAGGLATAGEDTDHALDTANAHTSDALGRSARSVQSALQKAASSTGRFLGVTK